MSRPLTGVGRSVWSVQFYEENDGIDFASGANIDDLLVGDCTIEAYVYIPAVPGTVTYVLTKNNGGVLDGWRFIVSPATRTFGFSAYFAVTNINFVTTASLDVGRWYHLAVDFDVGTLTARLFVNGDLASTSGTTTAVGAYSSDAARKLICNGVVNVGTVDNSLRIGPIRLSDSRRYTGVSFDPPPHNNWPANDANAQLITRMNDGAGATVMDYSSNGYDGTITFGANTRWYNDPV